MGARTSRHTVIIQVKQTQLITKDISISGRIHVEPLNKHLVVSSLLHPCDVSNMVTICMKCSNWLALCTGRLCIEPRMKMGARTSRLTVIIQVKQTQLITKDITNWVTGIATISAVDIRNDERTLSNSPLACSSRSFWNWHTGINPIAAVEKTKSERIRSNLHLACSARSFWDWHPSVSATISPAYIRTTSAITAEDNTRTAVW